MTHGNRAPASSAVSFAPTGSARNSGTARPASRSRLRVSQLVRRVAHGGDGMSAQAKRLRGQGRDYRRAIPQGDDPTGPCGRARRDNSVDRRVLIVKPYRYGAITPRVNRADDTGR